MFTNLADEDNFEEIFTELTLYAECHNPDL